MSLGGYLKWRREKIGISQYELADRLTLLGFSVSRPAIQKWENGKARPKLSEPGFINALATALEIDTMTLMRDIGIRGLEEHFSPSARRAAEIIDQLPEDRKDIALRMLEAML